MYVTVVTMGLLVMFPITRGSCHVAALLLVELFIWDLHHCVGLLSLVARVWVCFWLPVYGCVSGCPCMGLFLVAHVWVCFWLPVYGFVSGCTCMDVSGCP